MLFYMDNENFLAGVKGAPTDGYLFFYEQLDYLLQNGDDEFYLEEA